MGYSGPATQSGGMDPGLMDAITRYLMGQGPNPLGTNNDPGVGLPQPLPADMDEYGTQEDVNAGFTMQNKALGVMSDPAFIYMQGMGAGGFGPEQFNQPKYEYERVSSPALNKIEAWVQGNDPLRQMIAEATLDPNSPGAYDQVLAALASEPLEDGTEHPLKSMISLFEDDGETPDRTYIKSVIKELDSAIEGDYDFPSISQAGFEQAATDPGFTDGVVKKSNQIVIGDDGQAYRRTERELTPAEEYAERTGMENPYDTYNADDFAGAGVIDRENEAFAEGDRRRQQYDVDMANWENEYSDSAVRARAQAYVNELMGEQGASGGTSDSSLGRGLLPPNSVIAEEEDGSGGFGSSAASLAKGAWDFRNDPAGSAISGGKRLWGAAFGSDDDEGGPLSGGIAPDAAPDLQKREMPGDLPGTAMSPAMRRFIGQEQDKAQSAKPGRLSGMLTNSKTGKKMTMAESRAETDRMVRDAYVRQLRDAGFSPFEDQRRGLMANAYGPQYGQAPSWMPPAPNASHSRRYQSQSPQAQQLRSVANRHVGDPRDPRTWR